MKKQMIEKLRKKYKKTDDGITLIALIITIIIMLILVAVTISMAVNGGLFEYAGKATGETKNAIGEEQDVAKGRIQVDGIWYDSIEDYIGKKPSNNQGDIEKTVSKYKTLGVYAGEKVILEDDDKNIVVLPSEFKIAKDSGTNVYEGVVVEDEDGNQYVWIPVTKDAEGGNTVPYAETGTLTDGTEIKLSRYAFNTEGVAIDKGSGSINNFAYYGGYGTPSWVTDELTSSNVIAVSKNIEEFKSSVAENGGYYIARYEASYRIEDEKAKSIVSTSFTTTGTSVGGVYNTRSDGSLYNNVTQIEASEACQDLYLNVKSDLINSYAWDTAIVYIQNCSEKTTYSLETSKNNTLSNTGTNEDEVCKINDLASNLSEWTTEFGWWDIGPSGSDDAAVVRGNTMAGARAGGLEASGNIGFRAMLYN